MKEKLKLNIPLLLEACLFGLTGFIFGLRRHWLFLIYAGIVTFIAMLIDPYIWRKMYGNHRMFNLRISFIINGSLFLILLSSFIVGATLKGG
ncbi:MAG: hypothetical protein DRN00_05295 [Thermoplasmata archaeon]|nr:MAG: hypothetical protein DRN00_05295 [Thermoplasmata archaeon]